MFDFLKKKRDNDVDFQEIANKAIQVAKSAVKQYNDLKESSNVRYVQVDYKNEGDPDKGYEGGDETYQEWVSSLLDDSRFQWLIYKRQMAMIDVMTAIPTNDPKSAEMRQRAAFRMDGIQMLLDAMVAMKRAYKISKLPKNEEGLS